MKLYKPIRGTEGSVSNLGNIKVTTNISMPSGPYYLLIEWIFTNNDTEPHTIDLHTHADVQIENKQRTNVHWFPSADDRKGIIMQNKGSNDSHIIIGKEGYHVTPYDIIYFGRFNKRNQYYFWNRTDSDSLLDHDAVYTIGWTNRRIYPGEQIKFGVLYHVNEFNVSKLPPSLFVDESDLKTNYSSGDEIVIKVRVTNNLNISKYGLRVNCTYQNKTETYIIEERGEISWTHDFKFQLGNSISKHSVYCIAQNFVIDGSEPDGPLSNEYKRDFNVNKAPCISDEPDRPQNRNDGFLVLVMYLDYVGTR
ncbi:hypothetical protein TVAG_014410 [Trichomonas vaginalis G3]|uniref:Uncharacterized protein n=1 Tax=Trichomonas vaginalis (strain ATCC PRA-98 / G3) TaxID=412133 RepID=A2G560_TRIV3|nr:Listeria-Bacteroides repeat domain (List Bact rpt) family [Trichomonas vaginalis G3]EAX87702.1 hypothetical protein TVAG_014410 [Trichomonas vaginalis G3]KAI5515300.1 Listeria-Bacteroides repeat domain (List Bact rpt) family [Trichomonas vaginalis G3]|eukprot:XP_001300632.1 hypothetical protein [Trichomonas vaginalis G3]